MKAVIYVRVSSGEQVTGTSLDSQEEKCRAYCLDRGFTALQVFREEGESAKTADRTELLRAIAFCRDKSNGVRVFVVAKVGRLARSTEDHFYIRQLLQKVDVTIHSVSEPIGNSPTEKFIETVLAAGAEFDNAIRRQRCTDGMISRIKQGIYPWKPPIGYHCANHRKHDEKKTRPDAPEPGIFDIIQRGLKAYLSGEIRTLADMVAALDRWGLARCRGKPCSPQLADRLLGRYVDFYAGRIVNPWDGSVHRGVHLPMITEEEGQMIRLIRSGRIKPWAKRKQKHNPEFPLRRIVRCVECGRNLTGAFTRHYAYYTCCNRSCRLRGKTIPREPLHASIETLIRRVKPSIRVWDALDICIRNAFEKRAALISHASGALTKRIHDLEARRTTVFTMREDGTYSKEMFRERLAGVEMEIAEARLQLPRPAMEVPDINRLIGRARAFYDDLPAEWQQHTDEDRRLLERHVFPKGNRLRQGLRCSNTSTGAIAGARLENS